VHVQLLTQTKSLRLLHPFGDPPIPRLSCVLGLPGALPVLNKKAVEYAVLAAMALNCRINERSIFARKNYFYPDLPKGYQISQYDKPLSEHGWIDIRSSAQRKDRHHSPASREDAGKSLHDGSLIHPKKPTLIEPVRRPAQRDRKRARPVDPDEAYEYLSRLKEIILTPGW